MSLNTLEIVGAIADLKDVDYKNTLAVATLIELLINKGFFSREEFTAQALLLERSSLAEIANGRRQNILAVK